MFRHRAAFTYLVFVLLINCSILSSAAHAQRLSNINSPSAVTPPAPRDRLGFTPGDDHTIADWKQITDYFKLLDVASDRVKVRRGAKAAMPPRVVHRVGDDAFLIRRLKVGRHLVSE